MSLATFVRPAVEPQCPQIFLTAGEFHFGAAPLQLATLLGSCVTVTLWHPHRLIGGMCHFLVPRRERTRGTMHHSKLDGHFAEEAFLLFDQALSRTHSRPEEFQAKLFGGGDMFPDMSMSIDIGALNIDAARRLLRQRSIPLLAEHAGGAGHRRLVFDLATGEVQLRFAEKLKEMQHG
jgi:chemotaxis protein CheD